MNTPLRAGTLAALALLLAACANKPSRPPVLFQPVSPSGELLALPARGDGPFRAALQGWFARTDTDGSGTLSPAEFAADAAASFKAYDRNGDGSVTSAELTAVRTSSPYRPPLPKPSSRLAPRSVTAQAGQVEDAPEDARSRRPQLRTAADPVMAADADANFRVTEAEMLAQAERRFAAADRDRDGALTAEEVVEGQLRLLRSVRPF